MKIDIETRKFGLAYVSVGEYDINNDCFLRPTAGVHLRVGKWAFSRWQGLRHMSTIPGPLGSIPVAHLRSRLEQLQADSRVPGVISADQIRINIEAHQAELKRRYLKFLCVDHLKDGNPDKEARKEAEREAAAA